MKSFTALFISSLIYLMFYWILQKCLEKPRRNVEIDEMFFTYKIEKKNRKNLLEYEEKRPFAINSYDAQSE
jgi:hypothetical protein